MHVFDTVDYNDSVLCLFNFFMVKGDVCGTKVL